MNDITKTAQHDGLISSADNRLVPSTQPLWTWNYLGTDNQPVGFTPEATWRFDGTASQLLDRGPNGHDLTLATGVLINKQVDGITGLGFGYAEALTAAGDAQLHLLSDMTIEVVFCPYMGSTLVAVSTTGETAATNYLYWLYFDATGRVYSFHEYNAGVNVAYAFKCMVDFGKIQYLTFTRSAAGVLSICHNGVLMESSGALHLPSGGTSSIFAIGVAPGDASSYYTGYVFSMRIAAVAMTAAQAAWVYAKLRTV